MPRRLPRAFDICALLALTAVPATSSHIVKPDFSSSRVTHAPDTPREGDLITFTLLAGNSGADADSAWIVLDWPESGFFVGVRGLERPEVNQEAHRIEGYVRMPAAAERPIELDILTPRDSGGLTFTVRVRVSDLSSGTDHYDSHSVAIDSRIATGGVSFGGLRLTPAGVAVLAWVAALPLVWLGVSFWISRAHTNRSARWRTSPAALTIMLMLPMAFWAFFAVMAWRDYRSLTSWPRTECTVMGRRIVAETVSSSGTGRTQSRNNTVYSPELALRYTAQGDTVISTGYDTGSSLRIGGRAKREQETLAWTVGTAMPCWYDPEDVKDVVVHNGFGGAYLFALFPLPLFWFGCASLARGHRE